MALVTRIGKPTAAQVAVLRYYAGMGAPDSRNWGASIRACRDRDWLDSIEDFPYHRTTEAGLKALRSVS